MCSLAGHFDIYRCLIEPMSFMFSRCIIGKAKAPTPQVTLHDRIIESEEETGSISSHNGTYSLSRVTTRDFCGVGC